MRRVFVVFGILAVVGLGVGLMAAPVQAGFFETLFGIAPSRPVYAYPQSAPMDVTVRPRRGRASTRARGADRKAAAAHRAPWVRINPEKEPDWYLRDTTLRRGDIVVLKTGPVVFEGSDRPAHVIEDFASLKDTRYVSASGKRDIRMMVSGIWAAPDGAVETSRTRRRHASGRRHRNNPREARAE